jgi:hypothetical protein
MLQSSSALPLLPAYRVLMLPAVWKRFTTVIDLHTETHNRMLCYLDEMYLWNMANLVILSADT